VPRLFELLTALLEYLNILQGVVVPLPFGLLHLYDCDYEINDIVFIPGWMDCPCLPPPAQREHVLEN